MKKLGILAAAGLALAAGIAPSVYAQTANQFGSSNEQLETVGASDLAAMLSEFNIQSEVRASQRSGGAPVLQATTPGGAKFLIGFFQCEDTQRAGGCMQLMISTAQPSAGATYDDLNQFNGLSSVTTVVFEPANQILIFGRNVFLPGGVGRENVKLQVALFLEDMAKFSQSRSGSTASVSFNTSPSGLRKGKISQLNEEITTEAVQRMLISQDASLEVEVAISNATGVDFSID
ncbi:MAG: hypothetical protein AAFR03_09330 [Pseudomonadota bacterium]